MMGALQKSRWVSVVAACAAAIFVSLGPEVASAQPVEFDTAREGERETKQLDARDVVLTASRRVQTIQEAPMIVNVVTREQIEMGGYKTIEEILQTVPGFELNSHQHHRLSVVMARGQARSYLFMVDGVPHYAFSWNVPNDLERNFDVQMIEKIEVMSGPGGVPWGANALLGNVNIITRRAPEDGALQEFTLGGGSGPGDRNVLRAFALGSGQIGRIGRFNLMARYLQTDGPEILVDDSAFVNPLPLNYDSNQTFLGNTGTAAAIDPSRYVSGMANVEIGDFTLFAHVPYGRRYSAFGPGGSPVVTDSDLLDRTPCLELRGRCQFDDQRFEPLTYLRFRRETDRLAVQVTASYGESNYNNLPFRIWAATPTITSVPPNGVSADVWSHSSRAAVALELNAQLPARNTLNYGVDVFSDVAERRLQEKIPTPGDVMTVVDHSRTTFSAFLQDEWRVADPLALNAGIRYTATDDAYDPIATTSAAAVWNIVPGIYARLNYGQGFRPPSSDAAHYERPPECATCYVGNPDLDPEFSRSYEGELNFATSPLSGAISRFYIRLDYSYTELSGVIKALGGEYQNLGEVRVHTAEMLARCDLGNRSSLQVGYTYLHATDSLQGPLRFPANHILNLIGDYRLLPWLALTGVFTGVGPREDLNRTPDRAANQASMNGIYFERLAPYYLLRLGVVVKNVPVPVLRDFELRAFGNNLLNDPHPYSEADGGSALGTDKIHVNSTPREGWSVFADLTYRI